MDASPEETEEILSEIESMSDDDLMLVDCKSRKEPIYEACKIQPEGDLCTTDRF